MDPANKPPGHKPPPLAGKAASAAPLPYRPVVRLPAHRDAGRGPVQAKQGAPPLASEILKRFSTAPAGQLTGKVRAPIQLKLGPPPLASEILGRFQNPPARSSIQQKQGPPPLASDILARLTRPPGASAQAKPSRPSAWAIPKPTVQLFKVDGKNYPNVTKIAPLATTVCESAPFTDKQAEVTYWLRQYVSIYPTQNFTSTELSDYLYDDIIRQAKPIAITAETALTTQELLTTEHGFKRIKANPTVFPTGNIWFYRTMSLGELKELLKTEGQTTDPTLPNKNDEIKALIRSPKKLGDHVGDYKQARSYFKMVGKPEDDRGQALLQFTLGADFFKPSSVALPAAKSIFKEALVAKFGGGYAQSSRDQGLHDDMPGLKSESRGLYSVGLSAAGAEKFLNQCSSVKVIEIRLPA